MFIERAIALISISERSEMLSISLRSEKQSVWSLDSINIWPLCGLFPTDSSGVLIFLTHDPVVFASLWTTGYYLRALRAEPFFSANKLRRRDVLAARGYNIMRDPFTAGLLSFIIPGVGQLYNGRILAGILWLIITPGFWIGSGGTLGWICHIIAAYTAYSYAKDHPVRA